MKSITDNNNNINHKLALSAFLPKPFPMNPMIDILLKYSARWVLRPASVRGVEVAKPSAAAKARAWISDQVVNNDDFLHQI